mgnify:CR=1 FL=1
MTIALPGSGISLKKVWTTRSRGKHWNRTKVSGIFWTNTCNVRPVPNPYHPRFPGQCRRHEPGADVFARLPDVCPRLGILSRRNPFGPADRNPLPGTGTGSCDPLVSISFLRLFHRHGSIDFHLPKSQKNSPPRKLVRTLFRGNRINRMPDRFFRLFHETSYHFPELQYPIGEPSQPDCSLFYSPETHSPVNWQLPIDLLRVPYHRTDQLVLSDSGCSTLDTVYHYLDDLSDNLHPLS